MQQDATAAQPYFETLQHPHLRARVRDTLQRTGRVHIARFMNEERAQRLRDAMIAADWRMVLTGSGRRGELGAEEFAALGEAARAAITDAAYEQARRGFQCFYEACRIGGDYETALLTEGPLAEFVATVNSEPVLQGLRDMTGDDRIAYVDSTATRFKPGHFLTVHSDDVDGEDRLFAYVLNLAPVWRPDWGGLLMFYGADGHVTEAFTPKWGALNVFAVPQPHAVSVVAPFAGDTRYAISGWMRSRRPPGSRFGG